MPFSLSNGGKLIATRIITSLNYTIFMNLTSFEALRQISQRFFQHFLNDHNH